ncbi:MAG TPA: OsmC family protein [Steroidobacteraceae bacterium]|nr:OsmC family protein [Steroidobacteraceae bacterium]
MREHVYSLTVRWTGNTGSGTSAYRAYRRDHVVQAGQKPTIEGSSDPHFRGDPARWNPEELLLASLAACHQLWFLHLCAEAGIVVIAYEDEPLGWMSEHPDGGGEFSRVLLRPRVTLQIAPGQALSPELQARARQLHARAHALCFIARSVRFPVEHEAVVVAAPAAGS